eukprot:14511075-Alexandrium_andersonii.AAC.1
MRVLLGDAAALQQREQDFPGGVSPSEESSRGRNGTHAGLMSDEVLNSVQWVDTVVGGMSDAACVVHERAWNEWRASFSIRRGSLVEKVLHRFGTFRTEAWKAKFADEPVAAGELQGPPERIAPIPPSESPAQKKAVRTEKKGKVLATAKSPRQAEAATVSEAAAGVAEASENVATGGEATASPPRPSEPATTQSEGTGNTESMTGGPAPAGLNTPPGGDVGGPALGG